MKNEDVVNLLNAIADLLDIQDVPYKPEAYRKVARSIEGLAEDINDLHRRDELESIPGVGIHIAAKIAEFLDKGKLRYYDLLKKQVEVDVETLRKIPSLGPKKIKALYKKLNIKNVPDLTKAIKQKKIRELKGFGEKTEQLFLDGIEIIKTKPKRYPIKEIIPIANALLKHMKKTARSITKIEVAGSYRRKKTTVKDIDLLVVSNNPNDVMLAFQKFPLVKKMLARGQTKGVIRLKNNLNVDLRIVTKDQWGAALLYFTGTKDFNINMRKIALKKGWTLNEYNLSNLNTQEIIASKTEKEIFKALGLKFTKPEDREERKNWK